MAGFSLGALSHARDFLLYGLRPYSAAPLPFEVFWSSLIVLDLIIVATLLSGRIRLGAYMALLLMVVDVAVNSYAAMGLEYTHIIGPLVLQSVFLGVILGTIGILHKT